MSLSLKINMAADMHRNSITLSIFEPCCIYSIDIFLQFTEERNSSISRHKNHFTLSLEWTNLRGLISNYLYVGTNT
jgi:hypothetical protein